MRVKVVKNKVASPFKFTEFDILFGQGISRDGDLLDLACDFGIVEKAGTWYSCQEKKLGQGRESARKALGADAALKKDVEKAIEEKLLQKLESK